MNSNRFYFTFGSDIGFPYQNTYLIVIADNISDAIKKFRNKYPDRHDNTVNCAFWYDEGHWHGSLNEYVYGDVPAEIIN